MQAKTNANLQVGLQKIYKEGLDAFGDKSYFKDIKLTESGVNLSSIASGAYQVSVAGRLNFRTSNEETSWLILEVGDLIYTVKENVSWHKSIIIYSGNVEYIEDFDRDFKRCALKDIYELNQIIEIIGSILHIDGDGSQFLADDGTYKTVSSGTTDYTDLTNKPLINSVELTGNVSLGDLGIADKITRCDFVGIVDADTLGNDLPFEEGANQIVSVGSTTNGKWLRIAGTSKTMHIGDYIFFDKDAGDLQLVQAIGSSYFSYSNGVWTGDYYATLTDIEGKQDTLTAGYGISIVNNVISTKAPTWRTISQITTTEEVAYITKSIDDDGNAFNLSNVRIKMYVPALGGSTTMTLLKNDTVMLQMLFNGTVNRYGLITLNIDQDSETRIDYGTSSYNLATSVAGYVDNTEVITSLTLRLAGTFTFPIGTKITIEGCD